MVESHTPCATECAADVINIASIEAHTILKQNPVYTAFKHALLSAMQHLAAQFGERALARIKRIKETESPVNPRDVTPVASHAIGFAEPRHGIRSPGVRCLQIPGQTSNPAPSRSAVS